MGIQRKHLAAVFIGVCSAIAAPSAYAGPLVAGNLLVSDETFGTTGRVREFTPSGTLVQTLTFSTAGQPRDIVLDANGVIQIYNGTFTPTLTALNPVTGGTLSNTAFTGWSTVNNTTYGGIAALGNFVFVTDMATAGAGSPSGLIRFDINSLTGIRFSSGNDYIDVSAGRDGLLYGLQGSVVDVFDPSTLAFQKQINLAQSFRTIAVDQNGDIFAGNLGDSHIFKYNNAGSLLQSVTTPVGGFADLNIDASGRIVGTVTSGGTVLQTTRSLGSFSTFDPGTSGIHNFAAFVEPPPAPVPEPSSLALVGMGAVGLAGYLWRRRMRSKLKIC